MLFNSVEFLIFLPVVFGLYWALSRRLRLQNALVVASSYLFYGWWDVRFLTLIAFTTICSYISGLLIDRFDGCRVKQKWVSGINIAINLGILGTFKYYDFFAGSMSQLLASVGIEAGFVTLNIVLPVGISFYTFQALSYSIDVYRGNIKATCDLLAFTAFISFFPQLVAGPIERATNLLPQFLRERHFDYVKAVDGMRQILWGLFKKIVVADGCAVAVDKVFGDYGAYDSATLALGAVLFAMQIYGDFSGYSDIAIGTARLFGINLMRNFRFPYFSRDIAEFWRRWHISLNTWFRDYVYIPLGGSRCGKAVAFRNTMVIFLLSGLWHGANWTFVVWGAFHALLFLPLLLMGSNRRYLGEVAQDRWLPSIKETVSMLVTFALVTMGWIIFRADTIGDAWGYMCRMFTSGEWGVPVHGKGVLVYALLMLAVEWVQRTREHALQLDAVKSRWVRGAIYYALIIVILWQESSSVQFIYFQF